MSGFDVFARLAYLTAAAAFVVGLHFMNAAPTARRGNRLSASGMVLAVLVTLVIVARDGAIRPVGWVVMLVGLAVGGGGGGVLARRVQMTEMPELVSLFNAVGGGAAALVAIADYVRLAGPHLPRQTAVFTVLDVVIGCLTLSGSLVATGKLHGQIPGRPLSFRGSRATTAALALVVVLTAAVLMATGASLASLAVMAVAALALGVTTVLPIGGADMPVVISLLNAFTGTAVAMAGFVIDNVVLIIAGALVGASGTILTMLMAEAMNRSLASIVAGGFGTAGSVAVAGATGGGSVRAVRSDDVALQLAYAGKVIVVPGYGLAAAHAQHEVTELADLLMARGVEVSYAIHPVAGRMPGHMNVLLAEANVPYSLLRDMDVVNPEFARTDVVLVVGANDVVNPAARTPGSTIYGMPILNVDQARSVVVVKRSMASGYAGIDNELFTMPQTGMFFADAKGGLAEIAAAVRQLVGAP